MTIRGILIRTTVAAIICFIMINPLEHIEQYSKYNWWQSVLIISTTEWVLLEIALRISK